MGLLDEAIREHLELKRRHGADAAEVARLEQEALGPARRTPADVAQEPPEPAAAPDVAERPEPVSPAPAPAAAGDEYEYVFEEEGEFEAAEPIAEAAPAPAPPPAPPIPTPEQQTVEFEPTSEDDWEDDWDEAAGEPEPHVPPAAPAEGKETAASEDVLEETPEFLQETPEHDRLWFEQKPPRDFDF